MAKFEVQVLSLITTSEEDGAPAFEATGTIDGTEFLARTILFGPKGNKQLLFKVVEGEEVAQSLSDSQFTRGQRIAIARACKLVRTGKAALAGDDGLEGLTLKELREKAKVLSVAGTHRKGITKPEVRELVAAAA
jgi:hypothetical protein